MSFFEINVTKSLEITQLKSAIDKGDIFIACSDSLSNVFFASKNDVSDIIKVWQDNYPEIKSTIGTLKFHKEAHGAENFKSKAIDNRKEVKFVFLGIRSTFEDENEVECLELCVKYEFETYHHLRTLEKVDLLGRIFINVKFDDQ
jgi:hypothetical protein